MEIEIMNWAFLYFYTVPWVSRPNLHFVVVGVSLEPRRKSTYMKLDGWAVASVRVARGQENVLGGGVEFVVLLFSVVRHVDINLPRFAYMGVVSWARTSARRSAQESAKEPPYLCWKEGLAKNVFGLEGGLQTETSQEGYFPGNPTLPQSPM